MKYIKKIPILENILIGLVILITILYKIIPQVSNFISINKVILDTYFCTNRLNLIVNVSFILIGIYATITSVFGSSRSLAISRLAEKDLTQEFIVYISLAIISAFMLAFYIILSNVSNVYLLLIIIIWTGICLIRFLIVILAMYNYNVKAFKKMDIEDKNKYDELMVLLTQIKIELQKKNK